jgi:asparagine synthase (glutamine-hydrolysing)
MCGIAGTVNADFSYEKVIKNMGHRGPDEQNGYKNNNVNFFHLRLSILDIEGGHQPMHLSDKFTIIFNGEIYNHREIRAQFNLVGNTSSDTETLLLLYERFGTGFLDYLDGMFAFVIHDKVKNILFVARDRAGKKPFYYYLKGQKFAFASELNCALISL